MGCGFSDGGGGHMGSHMGGSHSFCSLIKSQMLKTVDVYSIICDVSIHSKEFNIEVLRKFIALHTFKGQSIVDALR